MYLEIPDIVPFPLGIKLCFLLIVVRKNHTYLYHIGEEYVLNCTDHASCHRWFLIGDNASDLYRTII